MGAWKQTGSQSSDFFFDKPSLVSSLHKAREAMDVVIFLKAVNKGTLARTRAESVWLASRLGKYELRNGD